MKKTYIIEVKYYKNLTEDEKDIYTAAYGYNISHKLALGSLEELFEWGYDTELINKKFLTKTKLRGTKNVKERYC